MPKQDWFLDPKDDHQAWAFREAINEFKAMTQEKQDKANRDE